MSWLYKNMKTPTLYWRPPKPDAMGDYQWPDPEEILCRWEYKNAVFYSSAGDEVASKAVVYASQLLRIEGYLWMGSIIDVSNDFQPPLDTSSYDQISQLTKTLYQDDYESQYAFAMRITKVDKMSLLSDNDSYLYKVYLT